ncbi:MAG: UDP-3-O-(3-hydroxymyristoyl)glucosamine N-acyltransferase [Fidelibacterota bacterium]
MIFSVKQIADKVNGTIYGDPDMAISGICSIDDGQEGCISFIRSSKFDRFFSSSRSSAVIVNRTFDIERGEKTIISVDNPDIALISVLSMFDEQPIKMPGVHPSAVIEENVTLGENCTVGPNVILENDVVVGDQCSIGANVFVGEKSTIGSRTRIHPNVTIYYASTIGEDVTIDSGTVIGADGFGWTTIKDVHYKIPQIGKVIIKNNVWIGANCTVDRGTFRDTIINENTKLDNSIQIAHNVEIGTGCLFAGQVGIAGSTKIGNFVTLAGQVGVVDHISIGDRCVVASKSGVMQSLEPGSFFSGTPARPHNERKRQDVVIKKLPEMAKRLRALEDRIEELSKDKN